MRGHWFFFFLPKIRFSQDFQKFERTKDFSKFWKKNRHFPKMLTKFEIFQKYCYKARVLKILTKIVIFKIFLQIKISYNLTKIEIFENFDQNRCFFKVLTKINSFVNSDKHRDFSKKKSKVEISPGIWNKFEILHTISEKSWFFVNLKKKSRLTIIFTKLEIIKNDKKLI